MLESSIEKYLSQKVKELKGMCIKFNSLSLNGLPDRIILLPNGRIYFVELKSPKKQLRPLQKAVCRRLEKLGFKPFVIDNKGKVDEFITQLEKYCSVVYSRKID